MWCCKLVRRKVGAAAECAGLIIVWGGAIVTPDESIAHIIHEAWVQPAIVPISTLHLSANFI